jgi:hypothetical protein
MLAVSLAWACSGAESPGGTSGPGGGQGTGGRGGGQGGDGEGGGGGGDARCDVPSTRVIGPDGGAVKHCGAKLVVPAGALEDDVSFTIAVDETPPDPPFERSFASPVFRMTPEAPGLLAPAELTLPHERAPGARFEMARYDRTEAAFFGFEACEVTDTTIGQSVFALGTLAVLRDVNTYPPSTSGLGGGAIQLSFLSSIDDYDLDAQNNYGIYASAPNGERLVTLNGLRDVAGGVESLRVDFTVAEDGASGSLVQVQWISTVTSTGYSFIDGLIGSGGALTISEMPDGRLVGEIAATLEGGNPPEQQPLEATFDVTVEKYAFPPELSCGGG